MKNVGSLDILLDIAQLARSTFYYNLNKADAPNQVLKAEIKAIFTEHQGCYGYRRITLALRKRGNIVNHKKVSKLMKELGLKAERKPKRKYQSYQGEVGRIAPNLLERNFTASKPNEKWGTDITEFKCGNKKLYLSPIKDFYNGEIVAYDLSRSPNLAQIERMLDKAVKVLKPEDKPILHTDQGWQYQHLAYRKRLEKHNILQSMSRKGNCIDNAATESFFGRLKEECYYGKQFENIEQLEQTIHDYIAYYNNERIQTKLKGLSPVEYRTQSLNI